MYLELYYVKLHILILWTRYGLIANNVTDRAVFTNYWRKKNFFQHSVTSPKQNTHTYTQQIKQKSANLSKLLEVLFLKIKKIQIDDHIELRYLFSHKNLPFGTFYAHFSSICTNTRQLCPLMYTILPILRPITAEGWGKGCMAGAYGT